MKICLVGHALLPMQRRLIREGHELVRRPQQADLSFLDRVDHIDFAEIDPRKTVQSGREVPQVLLEQMRMSVVEDQLLKVTQPTHFLSRWWEGMAFSEQVLAGVPLQGLPVDDSDVQYIVGSAFRFLHVQDSSNVQCCAWPDSPHLEMVLREWHHRGMVSIIYHRDKIIAIQTGVPFYSWFGLLELTDSSPFEQFAGGSNQAMPRFYEAWTCSQIYTRSPWPRSQRVASPAEVHGLNPSRERHFWAWPLAASGYPYGAECTGSLEIGVATAWSDSRSARQYKKSAMKDACWRAGDLCDHVRVKDEKGQYWDGTALGAEVEQRWIEARQWLSHTYPNTPHKNQADYYRQGT